MSRVCLASCKHFRKIGRTANPNARMLSLRCGNPFGVELVYATQAMSKENAARLERVMHEILSDYRTTGEWFHVPFDNNEIIRFIESASVTIHRASECEDRDLAGQYQIYANELVVGAA